MLALVAMGTLVLAAALLVLFTGWFSWRAQAAVPPLGEFVELDGARIHCVDGAPDVGSGEARPAIVMIHGLGGTMRSFTYAVLEDLRREFRVLALDRPGSGYSTRTGERASVSHQADLIARFIEAKGLDRPLIVGHSFGGAIALALALNHPGRVGGLALLAPLTHPQETIPKPFRGIAIGSPLLRWIVAWTLAVPTAIVQRAAMLDVIFGPDAVPADFATRGGGLLGLRPHCFYGMSTDLMAIGTELSELAARYGELRIPVGILFGSADRILDAQRHGASMAGKVKGLQLELLDGGGHMTPVTAPGRTADFIRRMAARVMTCTLSQVG